MVDGTKSVDADGAAAEPVAVVGEKKAADSEGRATVVEESAVAKKRPTQRAADSDVRSKRSALSEAGRIGVGSVIAAFVAGVLLVAAITAVVVFYRQAHDRDEQLAARDGALSAACALGRDISIYNYDSDIDGWFTRIKSQSTGEFLTQMDSADKYLKESMVRSKVRSTTDKVDCGYESGDKDSAQVIMSMIQTRSNFTDQGGADRALVVLNVTMRRVDGRWLADKMGSPLLSGGPGMPGGVPVPGQQDVGRTATNQPADPNQPAGPNQPAAPNQGAAPNQPAAPNQGAAPNQPVAPNQGVVPNQPAPGQNSQPAPNRSAPQSGN
ncbi:hypothetical protein D5S18_12110 [Nocardia panacis]|uniref:Mce-associated membrane protein n=1 Tax=Nocardia panacis TaxID=2340916 RepID=A0A3A4JZP5_9NOCA|nr:hypothetical protein D5S18_12110 [Nocardia panacis]